MDKESEKLYKQDLKLLGKLVHGDAGGLHSGIIAEVSELTGYKVARSYELLCEAYRELLEIERKKAIK